MSYMAKKKPNIFSILAPYRGLVILLVVLALGMNGLNLLIPTLVSRGIDSYTSGSYVLSTTLIVFLATTAGIFIFHYIQGIVQTYASEKVARDMRAQITETISEQDYATMLSLGSAKILTTLTADIDAIKLFVSQAVVTIVSSVAVIIGASILLISINWKLALIVLLTIPIIGASFGYIFGKVKELFLRIREISEKLATVINESVLGSAIIRVLNAQQIEQQKFLKANMKAQDIGLSILGLFAALIPIIIFVSGLATLTIVAVGGHYVIQGTMTLGEFTAFYSYLGMLIFPIIMIGFMSTIIGQATASYLRIQEILTAPKVATVGTSMAQISGEISVQEVTVRYGDKNALKKVSFAVRSGTKTAIIGPTAAGKSQLLYALTGLITPQSGAVLYDSHPISFYDPESFHTQVAMVFQDSNMFNMTIRENIAFTTSVSSEALKRAIQTAELSDFIASLPDGLDTVISERGTSLSGGQKQRILLARALAVSPRVLFLDDFTARVDANTERAILKNIEKNYPDLTLISVTQKISAVEEYDSIIVLMEGELLAQGTHSELLDSCPEYVQIVESQQSTNTYELQA